MSQVPNWLARQCSEADSAALETSYISATSESTRSYGDVSVTSGSSAIFGDVHYTVHNHETDSERKRLKEILDFLPYLGFRNTHERTHDQCLPGTGQWFLDSDEFTSWVAGPRKVLWCPGIPGAGKTCVAAIAVDKLRQVCQKDTERIVGCVYFDYSNRMQQSVPAVLGDLLGQFLQTKPALPKEFENEYKRMREDRVTFREREYLELLSIRVASFRQIFIVVDALDECAEKERQRLVKCLRNIGPQVSLLVTSRSLGDIAKIFTGESKLEIGAASTDIEVYLHYELTENSDLSEMVEDDHDLEREIIKSLVEKAQNMFLLARLHIRSLSTLLSKNALLNALITLPKELDETYDEVLKRIDEQGESMRTLGAEVLVWLVCSLRPLTLSEMKHALSVKSDQRRFDNRDLISQVHKLASSCAGLVAIDEKTDKIQLVHYTVREYLERNLDRLHPDPHKAITRSCLVYLNFEDFDVRYNEMTMRHEYPFAVYAAQNWGWHFAKAQADSELVSSAVSLLQKSMRATDIFFLSGSTIDEVWRRDFGYNLHLLRHPRGPHIASFFGLDQVVTELVARGETIDCRNNFGATPLHYAACSGQVHMLPLLLNAGVGIMARTWTYHITALECAAMHGNDRFVASLIAEGSDASHYSAASMHGHSAVYWAIHYDQLSRVEALLKIGADINRISTQSDSTALQFACSERRPKAILLLLHHGAHFEGPEGEKAFRGLACDQNAASSEHVCSRVWAALTNAGLCVDLDRDLGQNYNVLDFEIIMGHGKAIGVLLRGGVSPRQSWSQDQPAIVRWAEEPWFDQLSRVCSAPSFAPLNLKQRPRTTIIQVSDQLKDFRDIREISAEDQINPCVTPAAYMPNLQGLSEQTRVLFCNFEPHLTIEVPDTMTYVNRIHIVAEHRYGKTWLGARYPGMKTKLWLDIVFAYFHGDAQRRCWQRQMYLSHPMQDEWKVHVETWDVDRRNNDADWKKGDAIWSLRPGDQIRIYALSHGDDSKNFIIRKIKVKLEGPERE